MSSVKKHQTISTQQQLIPSLLIQDGKSTKLVQQHVYSHINIELANSNQRDIIKHHINLLIDVELKLFRSVCADAHRANKKVKFEDLTFNVRTIGALQAQIDGIEDSPEEFALEVPFVLHLVEILAQANLTIKEDYHSLLTRLLGLILRTYPRY